MSGPTSLPRILIAVSALILVIILFSNHTTISQAAVWDIASGASKQQSVGSSNYVKPFANSRFNGGEDLAVYPKPLQKIVGLVFAGRQEYVSILDCYIQRNLVRNGGWLDEVLWMINTDRPSDEEYLANLVDSVPEYIGHSTTSETGKKNYTVRYDYVEPETIYVKIDDDVVFFEDHTITAIVKRLMENPQYLLVSANVMNQPALSWVHHHLNTALPFLPEISVPDDYVEDETTMVSNLDWRPSKLPPWNGPADFHFSHEDAAPFKNHRWLPLPADSDINRTPIGVLGKGANSEYAGNGTGWYSWALAAQEHYSFLTHLENDDLYRYKFDIWNFHYDRLSINFIALRGDDIIAHPIPKGDERFLTQVLPQRLKRPAVLDGAGLAVHFGFGPQVKGHGGVRGKALADTDLVYRYRKYADEFICGRPWGSPMR